MKTKIKVLLTFLVISNIAFAQNTVKMTNNYGSENPEIQDIIDFENIYIEKLNFESEKIAVKVLLNFNCVCKKIILNNILNSQQFFCAKNPKIQISFQKYI